MKYTHVSRSLDFLEPDGYGPLDNKTILMLEERFRPPEFDPIKQRALDYLNIAIGLREPDDAPLRLSSDVATSVLPSIMLPNGSHLGDCLLINADLLALPMIASALNVRHDCTLEFRQSGEILDFRFCDYVFRSGSVHEWVDFSRATFAVFSSISLRAERGPSVRKDDLSFASAEEFTAFNNSLSTLEALLPKHVFSTLTEPPSIVRMGRAVFFSEELVDELREGRLIGLEPTKTTFEPELSTIE